MAESSKPTSEREIFETAPNAISLLREQHREVAALFDLYRDAAPRERHGIFERIADEIAAHSKIEESIFYPILLGAATEHELRKSVEEHLLMKRVITDLLRMDAGNLQFDSKVEVLQELVEHHVAEEESHLFELVGSVDEDALRTLGDMMDAAYRDLIASEPRKEILAEVGAAAPLPPA